MVSFLCDNPNTRKQEHISVQPLSYKDFILYWLGLSHRPPCRQPHRGRGGGASTLVVITTTLPPPSRCHQKPRTERYGGNIPHLPPSSAMEIRWQWRWQAAWWLHYWTRRLDLVLFESWGVLGRWLGRRWRKVADSDNNSRLPYPISMWLDLTPR